MNYRRRGRGDPELLGGAVELPLLDDGGGAEYSPDLPDEVAGGALGLAPALDFACAPDLVERDEGERPVSRPEERSEGVERLIAPEEPRDLALPLFLLVPGSLLRYVPPWVAVEPFFALRDDVTADLSADLPLTRYSDFEVLAAPDFSTADTRAAYPAREA